MQLSFAIKKEAQRKRGFHRNFASAIPLDAPFFHGKERGAKKKGVPQRLCLCDLA
jgi:hypothetical protein